MNQYHVQELNRVPARNSFLHTPAWLILFVYNLMSFGKMHTYSHDQPCLVLLPWAKPSWGGIAQSQLQHPALPLSMTDTWSELLPVYGALQALLTMHQDHDYLAILAPNWIQIWEGTEPKSASYWWSPWTRVWLMLTVPAAVAPKCYRPVLVLQTINKNYELRVIFQLWWLGTGNLISHWRFNVNGLAIQPFLQKYRPDYIVLSGANYRCLNSTISWGTSFGGSWQRELFCFLCPLFQDPAIAISLATGEIWSCQAVCVASLQKEDIHVLGEQDPRRILLGR